MNDPCKGKKCACEMDPYGNCSCEVNGLCPNRPDLVPGGVCYDDSTNCKSSCASMANCSAPSGGGGGGGGNWPSIPKQVTDCAKDYEKQWGGTEPFNCRTLLNNCCVSHGGNSSDCYQGAYDWCVMKHSSAPNGPVSPLMPSSRSSSRSSSKVGDNSFLDKTEGKVVATLAACVVPMVVVSVLLLV